MRKLQIKGVEFVSGPSLIIQVVVEQLFGENAYVVHLPGESDCLIVDPSFETDGIFAYLQHHQLTPAAILNTHGHADHIAGNAAIKDRWPACPLVIGAQDADKLSDPQRNLSRPFGMDVISPEADEVVRQGESYRAAGMEWDVYETPGHSVGHVIFLWKGGQPWVVLGGDVLFQRSIGRTDFPDGDMTQLAASIRNKLYTLPDSTRVLPGHGPETTIGEEKRMNPFVTA